MVTNDVDTQLQIYCGISIIDVTYLDTIKTGTRGNVHPNTVASFRWNGLVEHEQLALTLRGKSVLVRAHQILKGAYIYPLTTLPKEKALQLEGLDLRSLYRLEQCKAHRLLSIHLKLLRSLVLRPGQSKGHLRNVFGGPTLETLYTAGFVQGGGEKTDQQYPTEKGYKFMLTIMGAR